MQKKHYRPTNEFLRKINKFIDWNPIKRILDKELKKNKNSVGVKPYSSIKMFKILLLQIWYALSDRGIDESLNDRISFRIFAEFSIDERTPDHTTICRFRNNLFKKELDKKIFEIINEQLESANLIIKKGSILDASVVESSRKPTKSINLNRDKEDSSAQINNDDITYSADTEASWTFKAKKFLYGYKIHLGIDSKLGFIIAAHTTTASTHDTKEFRRLVKNMNLYENAFVLADKGYFGKLNRAYLIYKDLKDGIMHKVNKGEKLTDFQKNKNYIIGKKRGVVEGVFGTFKRIYGFIRTRYLGITKTNGQLLLSSIAFNLKKASSFVS